MYIKCSIYRGGTSRGVFFDKRELQAIDGVRLADVFKKTIDCFNQNSIDGLGGGISSTNKISIVSASEDNKSHVNWHFYQIGVTEDYIDDSGVCGNIISAVASFAINEKLIKADDGLNTIIIYSENIKKFFNVRLYVQSGKAREQGDYSIAGVAGEFSPVYVSALDPGGEQTGHVYSLKEKGLITLHNKDYNFTFCDFVNPFAYLSGDDFSGDLALLSYEDLAENSIINQLNEFKRRIATMINLRADLSIPRVSLIFKPVNFCKDGILYKKEDYDILVRTISLNKLHKTSPLSGLYNIACLCITKGTVANNIVDIEKLKNRKSIRIGHFGGVSTVEFSMDKDHISAINTVRSAREIMRGEINITI